MIVVLNCCYSVGRNAEAGKLLKLLGESDAENTLRKIMYQLAYTVHEAQSTSDGTADILETDIWIVIKDVVKNLSVEEQFVNYIEKHAGLLIGKGTDERGIRHFTFPHRTFQEYLVARHVVRNRFRRNVGNIARKGAGWREVLLLATGYLVFKEANYVEVLDAIDNIIDRLPNPRLREDWEAIWRAGDMLTTLGLDNARQDEELGEDIITKIRELLIELLEVGALEPPERADAGRILSEIGDTRAGVGLREDGLPDIAWGQPVPKGTYSVGGDDEAINSLDEQGVTIEYSYRMAKYPVTYIQFETFIQTENLDDGKWWDNYNRETFKYTNYPRVSLSIYHAMEFCNWLTQQYKDKGLLAEGTVIRLPMEHEWEIAARYPDGRIYAWGNEFEVEKANVAFNIGEPSSVGMYPDGKNDALDLYDLNGNVLEWTLTVTKIGQSDDDNVESKIEHRIYGGDWSSNQQFARSTSRANNRQSFIASNYCGFRVIMAPPIEELE